MLLAVSIAAVRTGRALCSAADSETRPQRTACARNSWRPRTGGGRCAPNTDSRWASPAGRGKEQGVGTRRPTNEVWRKSKLTSNSRIKRSIANKRKRCFLWNQLDWPRNYALPTINFTSQFKAMINYVRARFESNLEKRISLTEKRCYTYECCELSLNVILYITFEIFWNSQLLNYSIKTTNTSLKSEMRSQSC